VIIEIIMHHGDAAEMINIATGEELNKRRDGQKPLPATALT
jgi:hypothetical protein